MFSSSDIKNIVNKLHHENENAVGPMYIAEAVDSLESQIMK